MFEDASLDLPCPGCGAKNPRTIRWLKANSEIVCGCGATITVDSSQLQEGMKGVEKALSKFPRKITIKL